MNKRLLTALTRTAVTVCSLTSLAGHASAATILQPASASTNMGELFPAARAISKSALSVGYTTLVTNFDTYLASGPTSVHGNGTNIWGSTLGVRSGHFDLALGGSYLVSSIAFWNLIGDPSSVRQFNLLLDDNSAFSSPDNLGTFTALNDLGKGSNTAAQVFAFTETLASFVRLEILNTWDASSSHTAFNEVAFRVNSAPEPNAGLLSGLALLVVVASRRRSPVPKGRF